MSKPPKMAHRFAFYFQARNLARPMWVCPLVTPQNAGLHFRFPCKSRGVPPKKETQIGMILFFGPFGGHHVRVDVSCFRFPQVPNP